MRIIAVTNIKGGVGKTTTAVNLAYQCAAGGERTVLWDLDPQGAATWILRDAYPNLSVIPPGDPYQDLAERGPEESPTLRLLKMRRQLTQQCDTLFMDCPPGISLLTESVLRGVDALIVPVVPTPLSVRMLDELVDYLARQQWSDLILLPMFSMVDWRKSVHYEVVTTMRARFPQMLPMGIPYSSLIERIAQRRAPLNVFAPNSDQAVLYRAVWAEVQRRVPR